jgi:predicted solute-binding protein
MGFVMKRLYVVIWMAFMFGVGGCASVPPESVTLSSEVGAGIKKQHQAQISFVNLYFEAKRKDLDAAYQRALNTFFSTIAQSGSVTLTKTQLEDFAKDVIDLSRKNAQAKESLEKVRIELLAKLDDNYQTLNQANSTVTGLLQSVVSTKEAANKSIQLISTATDGRIQLDKVFAEIDSFVVKGGSEAGKTIDLIEKIRTIAK